MLQDKFKNLASFSSKNELSSSDKLARKTLVLEVISSLKTILFKYFYEEFFDYSVWTSGYQEGGVNIYARNNRYSSYINFKINLKDSIFEINFKSPILKKIFGIYPIPVSINIMKKIDTDRKLLDVKSAKIEFHNLTNDLIKQTIETNIVNFLKNEELIQTQLKDVDDKEVMLFNENSELKIDTTDFFDLYGNNFNFDPEFIKNETKLMLAEASVTNDLERKSLIFHAVSHLNLQLISKYIYLIKNENLNDSEKQFMINELYSALLTSAKKWTNVASFSTYANYWIFSKFSRSKIEIARQRSNNKYGVIPTYEYIFTANQNIKNTTGLYPSIDELTNITFNKAKKIKKEKDLLRAEKEKKMFDSSGLVKLIKVVTDTDIDVSEIENHKIHINKLMEIIFDEREYEIVSIRYNLANQFNNEKKQSLQVIGDRFQVTRERIRQIEKTALNKLRKAYSKYPLDQSIDKEYLKPLEDKLAYKSKGKYKKYKTIKNKVGMNIKELVDYIIDNNLDFYGELYETKDPEIEMYLQILQPGTNNEKISKNITIDFLNLSVRSRNALKNHNIKYISEIEFSELEFIPNLGKKSIDEIINKVTLFNRTLKLEN